MEFIFNGLMNTFTHSNDSDGLLQVTSAAYTLATAYK